MTCERSVRCPILRSSTRRHAGAWSGSATRSSAARASSRPLLAGELHGSSWILCAWTLPAARPRPRATSYCCGAQAAAGVLTYTGDLPGAELGGDNEQSDPWPRRRGAALRRVADDQLVALSGGGDHLLCRLLAPGAPFGTSRGACSNAGRTLGARQSAQTLPPLPLRATSPTTITLGSMSRSCRSGGGDETPARCTGSSRGACATRCRDPRPPPLAVGQAVARLLLRPGRVRTERRRLGEPDGDMAKPGHRPPVDQRDAVDGGVQGPAVAGAQQRLPATRRASDRPKAVGGALLAWSTAVAEPVLATRSIAAGTATGPAAVVRDAADAADDDDIWTVVDGGLVAVSGGTLLIEQSLTSGAVRALPLNADGAVRGPASRRAGGGERR